MVFRYASYDERDKDISTTCEVLRNAWVAKCECRALTKIQCEK